MNPEDSMFRREQAQDLYLYSDKTQKEIAVAVGVSERTLYEWIKRYEWSAQKQRIHHPPVTLSESIVQQLTNLQKQILAKDTGVPSVDQANIMHKLVWCLFKLNAIPPVSTALSGQTDTLEIEAENISVISTPPFSGEKSAESALAAFPLGIGQDPTSEKEFFPKPEDILPPVIEDQSINPLPTPPEIGSTSEEPGTGPGKNDVISTPTFSGERSAEQTDNSLACPPLEGATGEDVIKSISISENEQEPPLTYREKMWELAKKDAKEKRLWQPRGLPSDLLEPGTPEWEERERKRRATIDRIKEEMKREHDASKRRKEW